MGEEENFPAGYRFNPTKVELIEQYLRPKVSGKPLPSNVIKEVDIYDYQPEVLYERFPNKRIQSRYFFTKLDKRFKNKRQRDRKVKNGGRWICSIGDKPVIKNGGQCTGAVYKTLTYYEGNDKSKKTGWIMIEYRLFGKSKQHQPTTNLESDWALCEIHYKGNKAKDNEGDDYKEEDKIADQDEPDQQEEFIGKSKLEPWLANGASTSYSFSCHGDDQIPTSKGGEVQAADASTSYGFDACYGGGQISCNGDEEVQAAFLSPYSFSTSYGDYQTLFNKEVQTANASTSYSFKTCYDGKVIPLGIEEVVQAACATPYSFSNCYGDYQTLFNKEVQAANASTSYSFNTGYDGQHIPLGIEEEVQAVGASVSHSFSTCHGFSLVLPDVACSSITGNTTGLLTDFTHPQHDMVTVIPGSSQVAALLSSDGIGVDQVVPRFVNSQIVTGSGFEDSPLEQPPVLCPGDWFTENAEELENLNHSIQQDFPNLVEDMAWLPLPTKAAPPDNARLVE